MAQDEMPVVRIREYLRGMTPQARKNLLVEIERMQKYGETMPGAEILLSQLRAEFRETGQSQDRVGNPSRYFFQPIELLFVDRSPERANCGQISRGSLSAIWEWINRDLLRTMAQDYCDRMNQVLVAEDPHKARLIAAEFQGKVQKYLEATLASTAGVDRARAGLAQYTSSQAAYDDLRKIASAFKVRDALVAFNRALPSKVERLEGVALAKVWATLDAFASSHPEAVPFALTMIGRHLKTPWQLIRLATETASAKNAAEMAATRYAVSISMGLDFLDDRRLAVKHAMKSDRIQIARDILVEIYDIEDALRVRVRRIEQTDWGRRLDELMAAVAADLETEFHRLPEGIHHVLGSRKLHRRHGLPGVLPDKLRDWRNVLSNGAAYCRSLVARGSPADHRVGSG